MFVYEQNFDAWFGNHGDSTFRLNYDLNEDSLVFDLGGYEGKFAQQIYNKYQCTVYIFEPVKEYYLKLQETFKDNAKIKVFPFGLGALTEELYISVSKDASSVCRVVSENTEKIYMQNISLFLHDYNIDHIDLIKINIEGGEFDILPILIETGDICKIQNIQVQFHKFIENAETKYEQIKQNLSKTHALTWHFYFIWENWQLL